MNLKERNGGKTELNYWLVKSTKDDQTTSTNDDVEKFGSYNELAFRVQILKITPLATFFATRSPL